MSEPIKIHWFLLFSNAGCNCYALVRENWKFYVALRVVLFNVQNGNASGNCLHCFL
jgi:hypothetical protein